MSDSLIVGMGAEGGTKIKTRSVPPTGQRASSRAEEPEISVVQHLDRRCAEVADVEGLLDRLQRVLDPGLGVALDRARTIPPEIPGPEALDRDAQRVDRDAHDLPEPTVVDVDRGVD